MKSKTGVSIRKLNFVMAAVIFVISGFLLASSLITISAYTTLRDITEDYIRGERNIYQMQETSDYLTDQVRSFAETGDRVYLDNYFRESEITKRRESALEELAISFSSSDVYEKLSRAMEGSTELMQTEYYAMRLVVESNKDFDLSDFPEQIQQVTITEEDNSYSRYGKQKRAQEIVFGDEYREKKEEISQNIKECMVHLMDEIEARQAKNTDWLGILVLIECILIVLLISAVLGIVFMTLIQVIHPLIHAIPLIRDDKPIQVCGASEFRFLAHTYNRMYEENRDRKEELAYEASHDQLTGVYNRKGYEKLIQKSNLNDVAFLLIDVDHFKGVNDSFGHETGDRLLNRLTETVREQFRTGDALCRVGGDEFVLLMFGTNRESKSLIREKITNINRMLQQPTSDIPAASVSVGVAFGNGETGEELYKMADQALYFVKEHGRNGCAFYGENHV